MDFLTFCFIVGISPHSPIVVDDLFLIWLLKLVYLVIDGFKRLEHDYYITKQRTPFNYALKSDTELLVDVL